MWGLGCGWRGSDRVNEEGVPTPDPLPFDLGDPSTVPGRSIRFDWVSPDTLNRVPVNVDRPRTP